MKKYEDQIINNTIYSFFYGLGHGRCSNEFSHGLFIGVLMFCILNIGTISFTYFRKYYK